MIGMKDQYFGVEVEMTGITREQAAQALANYFGTEPTIGFQRRRDCKAYRLLGAADICHHKVCCHRVKAARHALHGRVIRL